MSAHHGRYLTFTGGVGGAKLALGLSKMLSPEQLTLVVNTGDDFEHLGLHISPDIDTLVYTLSGECNPDTGWGRRDETWHFMQALKQLGGETWFNLGDRDLAMHVQRTRWLRGGETLTGVTARLASALGIRHAILPMSDDAVRTRVNTADGWLDFQHYFVREQCAPAVTGFEYRGASAAQINPAVLKALCDEHLAGIIICPSNPFASIDPILALPGMRALLRDASAPVIAVSPVVGGAAIKGPTVKMMQELSLPQSASAVAAHYQDDTAGMLDGYVIDQLDRHCQAEIEDMNLAVQVCPTVMQSLHDRICLAEHCLAFLQDLRRTDQARR